MPTTNGFYIIFLCCIEETKHHRPGSGPVGTSFDGSPSVVFIVLNPRRFANQKRPACVIGVAKRRTTVHMKPERSSGSQGLWGWCGDGVIGQVIAYLRTRRGSNSPVVVSG